jgi:hypothetical protein
VLVIGVPLLFAHAATLGGLLPESLGAGGVVVTACDDDGFTADYTTSAGNVTAVTVGGIADPGCEGGVLRVTLTNGSTSIAGGGPVTIPTDPDTADNSVTVALSPAPSAAQVTGIHVAVVGP